MSLLRCSLRILSFEVSSFLNVEDTEYSQLDRIIELCGDFYENGYTPELINQCSSFRDMEADKKKSTRKLKDHLKHLNESIDDISLDFLDQLLQVNPNTRLSC